MKNRENGMIDLAAPRDPDLSSKPMFIKPTSVAALLWIVGGIIIIGVVLLLWLR